MKYKVTKTGTLGGLTRNRARVEFEGGAVFLVDKVRLSSTAGLGPVWVAQHERGGRLVVDDAPSWLKLVDELEAIVRVTA